MLRCLLPSFRNHDESWTSKSSPANGTLTLKVAFEDSPSAKKTQKTSQIKNHCPNISEKKIFGTCRCASSLLPEKNYRRFPIASSIYVEFGPWVTCISVSSFLLWSWPWLFYGQFLCGGGERTAQNFSQVHGMVFWAIGYLAMAVVWLLRKMLGRFSSTHLWEVPCHDMP